MRRCAALGVLAFLVVLPPGRSEAYDQLQREVVAPLYTGYREAAGALAAVEPDCGAWREALRPPFSHSLLAWRRLEALGYGPAADPETVARVYFWPDKHGTAGRQLAAALRARDARLETAAGLEGQSAGLQSLAALEQLLHGEIADAEGFGCRYGLAIADFQAALAARMAAALPEEVSTEALFNGLRTTLDTVIALDLERPLGADLAAARGQRARAWRSGLSLDLIDAALGTVERVYAAPGGLRAMVMLRPELAAFDAVVSGRLRAAREAMTGITVPLHLAVADPEHRPQVEALLEKVRAVRRLMVERLAPALGFASGFNALDGD